MTSGLRSVRDKVVARLEDRIAGAEFDRFHELATAYGTTLRDVRTEDEEALAAGGLTFNSNALLAGQFPGDTQPVLVHVYPEGNWVEATDDAPYFVIGRSSYGKPILDRMLRHDSTLDQALSLAYLAFDATNASTTDVDFPIDVGVQQRGHQSFTTRRYTANDLSLVHATWQEQLTNALDRLPTPWTSLIERENTS